MGKLGVIGGSGFYRMEELEAAPEATIETPFGRPSAAPRLGRVGKTDVVFIPRHGEGHRFSPSDVPYRANIYALKAMGVTHLLSFSAVGSLAEELPPPSLVLPDQIIDWTQARPRTFFDAGVVAHVGLADPFCSVMRRELATTGTAGLPVHVDGTYICIEGPQFSTRAESRLYRSWGASVIGMTAMPEARLAREAEFCYATVALVTDYDVWHDDHDDVGVDLVLSHLQANLAGAVGLLRGFCEAGLPARDCRCGDALGGAVMTAPERIELEHRRRLGVIGERYLDRSAREGP